MICRKCLKSGGPRCIVSHQTARLWFWPSAPLELSKIQEKRWPTASIFQPSSPDCCSVRCLLPPREALESAAAVDGHRVFMTRAGARAGAAKIHKLSCLQFASAAGAAVPLWRIGGQGAGIVGGAEEKGKTRPTKAASSRRFSCLRSQAQARHFSLLFQIAYAKIYFMGRTCFVISGSGCLLPWLF